jgi:hypothetical protein
MGKELDNLHQLLSAHEQEQISPFPFYQCGRRRRANKMFPCYIALAAADKIPAIASGARRAPPQRANTSYHQQSSPCLSPDWCGQNNTPPLLFDLLLLEHLWL